MTSYSLPSASSKTTRATLRTGAVIAVAAATLLAACGDDKKPATQLAAKVNADEISIHQVNNALALAGQVPPDKVDLARREVLNRLVDQQVAVQQAVEQKLDRSPEVMMSIEAARKDILTRAYFAKLISSLPKPEADEIRKYHAEHPQLFTQRRIFNIEEILMRPGSVPGETLRGMATSKSLPEIASWLKGQGVPYSVKSEARASEMIPLEMLPKLTSLKDGQITVVEQPGVVAVMRLAGSRPAPVDEANSLKAIEVFLANQRARDAVNREVERLKSLATIEYMNEFAVAAGEKPTATAAKAEEKAPAAGPAAGLEKGIAALK